MAKSNKKTVMRGHAPTKRSINLATVGETSIDLKLAIPAIILIVIAAVAFSKFAVVDRMLAASDAEHEVSRLQALVDDGYEEINSYGDLTETYAHYTYSGMTDEELSLTDRIAVMEIIERDVMSEAEVTGWSISGNVVTLPITGITLQHINLIIQKLEEEDMVNYCTVSTAATQEKEDGDGTEIVTAQVTIYLSTGGEEA